MLKRRQDKKTVKKNAGVSIIFLVARNFFSVGLKMIIDLNIFSFLRKKRSKLCVKTFFSQMIDVTYTIYIYEKKFLKNNYLLSFLKKIIHIEWEQNVGIFYNDITESKRSLKTFL